MNKHITITISTLAGIKTENNLLFLTYGGDLHPNIIPISSINYIGTVTQNDFESPNPQLKHIKMWRYGILINNDIEIVSKVIWGEEDADRRSCHALISDAHGKLTQMMIEYHKDQHSIYKPKPFKP